MTQKRSFSIFYILIFDTHFNLEIRLVEIHDWFPESISRQKEETRTFGER